VIPVDVLEEILIVGVLTLAFVAVTECTIVTISYLGLREFRDMRRKLAPVIAVVETLSDEEVSAAATKLKAWFAKDRALDLKYAEINGVPSILTYTTPIVTYPENP
jgi:hypothetical protein